MNDTVREWIYEDGQIRARKGLDSLTQYDGLQPHLFSTNDLISSLELSTTSSTTLWNNNYLAI